MPNMVENEANFSGPNSGLQVGQNFGAITIQTDSLLGECSENRLIFESRPSIYSCKVI